MCVQTGTVSADFVSPIIWWKTFELNNMSASNYSLKINRDLLDPDFESYRLSQDSIPMYKVELDTGETTPLNEQYRFAS